MNLEHSRRTVYEWNDDDKNWWTRRSSLEQKLIILLAVIGVLIIGFLIYFVITHAVGRAEVCNTPGCLLAASQIVAHMDTAVDPCDDFYKFACGKFMEQAHGDSETISKLGIHDLIERQLKEIIQEPVQEDDHYLVKSQKQLFQACLNESAIEVETLGIFKRTLRELGGWPVVVGYHWKAKQFDWQDMIYELRKRGYEYSMMLSVYPGQQYYAVYSNATVVIAEPDLISIEEEHKDLYIKYMVDVAVEFGAERHLASIEMEQVFDFMMKLKTLVNESLFWRLDGTNATEYDWGADELTRTFTVEEFQSNHNEMDWLEFINTIISPLANISSDDYVLFPNPEFTSKLFYLLYRTLKRTQANYIIWTVLQSIMPYMPKELKQLEANYTCATVQQSPIQDRFEFCKDVVDNSFFSEVIGIIYARRYLSEEKQSQAQELFDNIKSALSASIMETTWMDEESKQNNSESADAIIGIIGFDEDYFNDTVLEKLEIPNDPLEHFGKDGFFRMLLKSNKRLMDALYYEISIPSNESNMQLVMDTFQLFVDFSGERNTLLLSPKILQGVYFNGDKPKYLNYGALGAKIGHHLAYGFDENFWTEETIEAFNEQTECFNRNFENFGLKDTINEEADITIYEYTGVKLAYVAYNRWVEENAEEPQLPGIEYTPKQLFWISAMLPRCYMLSEELNSAYMAGPMMNSLDFADDFSCDVDSKMNPSEKCQII